MGTHTETNSPIDITTANSTWQPLRNPIHTHKQVTPANTIAQNPKCPNLPPSDVLQRPRVVPLHVPHIRLLAHRHRYVAHGNDPEGKSHPVQGYRYRYG